MLQILMYMQSCELPLYKYQLSLDKKLGPLKLNDFHICCGDILKCKYTNFNSKNSQQNLEVNFHYEKRVCVCVSMCAEVKGEH